jgi:hypothetical protein
MAYKHRDEVIDGQKLESLREVIPTPVPGLALSGARYVSGVFITSLPSTKRYCFSTDLTVF